MFSTVKKLSAKVKDPNPDLSSERTHLPPVYWAQWLQHQAEGLIEKSEEAGDSKMRKKHDSETAEEKAEREKRKKEKKERWQQPQGGHYHLRLRPTKTSKCVLEEIAAPKKVKADASLPAESAPDPNETEEQGKRSL
ncbi:hypothetical protein QBC32DRAFT_319412 [Pseudoneurospora amorphoporcata]|uniref:Uncharacterized protein n=1 Tax=Pseudoneurospora amorphoporcata TaxID=241081 RepID=A0AAN6NJG3_9PEZI|nr:hypothetical protein QBC32DRAFT_319412 [Pseudoneurospora amorphoporcata]